MIIQLEVRNRFKGLDLIDRVPEELWVEVHDIVLMGIKTIPMEKKCKKTKWLSEEALQIAEKSREASESEVAQSCTTLSDPMVCSPPGSSVHGIFQARVLEWGALRQ